MSRRVALSIAVLSALLGACQSSSSDSCSYSGATQLAPTTWPKFRADSANSGRAAVDLATLSQGVPSVLFQGFCTVGTQACRVVSDCSAFGPTATATATGGAATPTPTAQAPGGSPSATVTNSPAPTPTIVACQAIGPIASSPVIGEPYIYLASTDGAVYVLDSSGTLIPLRSGMGVPGPIFGTPLVGANGNVFVPGPGVLTQFFSDGTVRNQASLFGTIASSPNIWSTNGTTYLGSSGGVFAGICPNGVQRYSVSFPGTSSSPAVVQDPHLAPGDLRPIAVSGGANGLVRAYDIRGRQYYAFTASSDVIGALMVDDSADPRVFYVPAENGQLFIVNLESGQSVNPGPGPSTAPIFRAAYCNNTANTTCVRDADCQAFDPTDRCIRAKIIASPALSRDATGTMYVADNTGVLWALNRSTGAVIWTYPDTPPPPQRRITSSPAVATGGTQDVVVFAVDYVDGNRVTTRSRMVALVDNGAAGPSLLANWHSADGQEGLPVCGTVGSSSDSTPASSPAIAADGTVYIGLQSVGDADAPECDQAGIIPSTGGGLAAIR